MLDVDDRLASSIGKMGREERAFEHDPSIERAFLRGRLGDDVRALGIFRVEEVVVRTRDVQRQLVVVRAAFANQQRHAESPGERTVRLTSR